MSEHLHSIQVSCRLANAQLREWNSHLTKPTEGSMMYEVKFANKLRDKGWERLHVLTIHFLLMKYMFKVALNVKLKDELSNAPRFSLFCGRNFSAAMWRFSSLILMLLFSKNILFHEDDAALWIQQYTREYFLRCIMEYYKNPE